jgi:signal transduction histidine kinase
VDRIRDLIRRYRHADPFKADLAIALVFVAVLVLEASVEKTGGGSRAATALVGSAAMLCLAWRRRNPLAAAVAFAVLSVLQTPLDSFFYGQSTNSPFVAALLMSYSIGRWLSGRRAWVAGATLIAGITSGVVSTQFYAGFGDLLWIGVLFFPPLIAGQAIRNRVALRRELSEKAERLEAEREVAAQRAVEEERSRIASELQAVVASGVTAMVVQAEAVPRLLAAQDPAQAARSFEIIEETGRDALAEMRRLLGVLRREGQRPELAPQPGLARLDALVERLRSEGCELELVTEGEPRPLAQGIDLTAYRVIQEALDDALKAEAKQVTVRVRYGQRELGLEVRDDRAGSRDGSVTSLRERVNLYGGRLRVSRDDGGVHLLEARLPATAPTTEAAAVGGAA